MSPRIHFIGTVHGDPLGAQRLEKALECEIPTILTLECSRELINYIENEGIPAMHRRIESLDLSDEEAECLKNDFGKIEYEIEITRQYAFRHNVPLHYIDHPSVVKSPKRKVSQFMKLSADDLRTFLNPSSCRGTNRIYLSYQKLFSSFDGSEQQEADLNAHHFGLCDAYMAQKLEKILESGARVVHVGGIGHCLQDAQGRTLFSKLRKYNPTRETLKWYDEI